MERLLAIWVADLARVSPDGAALRDSLALLDALHVLCPFSEPVRAGLYVLPVRGPSRFFGGEEFVLHAVRDTVRDVVRLEASLGIADGLFCAELAAHEEAVLAVGASATFRRAQPLAVLGRADLVTTCRRLGLHTVGSFADLNAARVAERFNKHALQLHRVARGELSELATQRDPGFVARLGELRGDHVAVTEQLGFFGQRGAEDDRAHAAAHRVRRRLGADAVVVATVRGGRAPQDRATLVPWGSPSSARENEAPWPGQLRAPSPATTLGYPVGIELRDAEEAPVRMGSRGLLSAPPVTLSYSSRVRRDVLWYAGPWPTVERWWATPRRRAHLQVVLASGEAVLVVAESNRWWIVGIYD